MELLPRRSFAISISPLRHRKSFSYNQLPEEPIKLTILKLDGSNSFGTYPLYVILDDPYSYPRDY
ncbi:unnamed protein product [Eruca vesicaria subsp. sativa]|uniref:Uncharacterized protein n=1 Tax=Eruca vesicaria subsp. sativa TaxID=29727 RepID=A0ABC8KWT1_ERUVS|nr:unnamed protein product [Eruca vesicaria subsp. sativa]